MGRIADGPLRRIVRQIDEDGHYPVDIMAALGEAGAFAAHLRAGGERIDLAIEAMEIVSRQCGSTGFLMWCQNVCGLYLERSGQTALVDGLLPAHAAGRSFGGTALSNPMKSFAGIEQMALRAEHASGGWTVTGALPWVSHLSPGGYCGAIASIAPRDGEAGREVMFLLRVGEGVRLRACPRFSGMEGTSTWGLSLDGCFVPDDDVIADPARELIGVIRNRFILLQTGWALGIVSGSIALIRDVEGKLGHVNRFLRDRPDTLDAEHEALRDRIAGLARDEAAGTGGLPHTLAVLEARADVAELALRASQSALLHQGARGYVMSAAAQRRVREAHFVAIVTPAIKHLRWEIARLRDGQ